MDTHEKELQRLTRKTMRRCIHFNGVMNDECETGVNYHGLMGVGFGCFKHMPCLSDPEAVNCSKASFPSETEARAEVEAREVKIQEFVRQLNEGVCPTCKVKVRQQQIGRCVYGDCGHRLYQGKVNPEHADPEFVAVKDEMDYDYEY